MANDAEDIKAMAQGSIQGAIEAAMKPFNDLLAAMLGPSAEAAGLLLKDYVTAFRIEKQVQLLNRLRRVLDRAGIRPARVPMKLLGPIFDAATLDEDSGLQEIWANMLANAANPDSPDAVAPSFPGILKEMRPADVKFLATLCDEFIPKFPDDNATLKNAKSTSISYKSFHYAMKKAGLQHQDKYYHERQTKKDAYVAAIHSDNRELAFILDTLQRQRIIEQEYGVTRARAAKERSMWAPCGEYQSSVYDSSRRAASQRKLNNLSQFRGPYLDADVLSTDYYTFAEIESCAHFCAYHQTRIVATDSDAILESP